MKDSRIAKRYSKALFEFGQEHKITERLNEDMLLVARICKSNRDFRLMLASPLIKADKKFTIIKRIFEEHLDKVTLTYFKIITTKRREIFIPAIAEEYIGLYKEYQGIKTAYLITAVPVDDKLRTQIITLLKEQTDAKIELHEIIDEELIGGFVLKYDDKQYDASILNQIHNLKMEFDTNIYIKEF